jgi:hypothetical protein
LYLESTEQAKKKKKRKLTLMEVQAALKSSLPVVVVVVVVSELCSVCEARVTPPLGLVFYCVSYFLCSIAASASSFKHTTRPTMLHMQNKTETHNPPHTPLNHAFRVWKCEFDDPEEQSATAILCPVAY